MSKVLRMKKINATALLAMFSLLMGCSSICLVNETEGAKNVNVIVRYTDEGRWKKENDLKLKLCVLNSRYSYSQGPVFTDYIPSFTINSEPSCLLKKAKNEAINHKNLIVIEDAYHHFELGLQYHIETYRCPKEIQFERGLSTSH